MWYVGCVLCSVVNGVVCDVCGLLAGALPGGWSGGAPTPQGTLRVPSSSLTPYVGCAWACHAAVSCFAHLTHPALDLYHDAQSHPAGTFALMRRIAWWMVGLRTR